MICENKECNKKFTPKTHNQKYCKDECCRIATNKRIMEKYYEKKAIKNGAERLCKRCKIQLSRYNKNTICSSCEKNINTGNVDSILKRINDVS
jgi:hypothetical protein